jgi:uncharacterized protein
MNYMFKRKLSLTTYPDESFFLWGPRQTGKTTLLRETYPQAIWLDLLKAEEFRRYLEHPERLREELKTQKNAVVVIDEVQKIPALLDEVHWLIENFRSVRFALCGSSARKLKRGHANLLGGRAIRKNLFGLSAAEIGNSFDLTRLLNHGYLPRLYSSTKIMPLLDAYVSDYLKEEIATEGLVRNLPVFSNFLSIAALSDTELINFSTIGRECGTSSHTIESYFSILVDTYQGSWLPAFRKRPKRRVIGAPKFYFSDVGVVNYLGKRKSLSPGNELFGKAFENWVHHELRTYHSYQETYAELSYWRLAGGTEVDFIVNDMEVAIEAKASSKIHSDHLKGLRELKVDHPRLKRSLIVCLEPKARTTEDGIEVIPYQKFVTRLWSGELGI